VRRGGFGAEAEPSTFRRLRARGHDSHAGFCAGGQHAADLWIDHRHGLALKAKGRKEAASSALNRFVGAGEGQKASVEASRVKTGGADGVSGSQTRTRARVL